MIIAFDGKTPVVDATASVHSSAQVIGDVHLGAQCSVWFNTVIRGDVHHVRIGARTNIQDNSTVHVTGGRWPTIVGADVTVAHGVILHGCTIGDRCLVAIGAIVLDGAEIGEECMIGAGALVTPGTRVPPGHLLFGSPARIVRPLTSEERDRARATATKYVRYAEQYRAQGIL
jgi:carbonic anhydrase/acetyltransferase-like protein (isoleucine patch superfamily)